MNKSKFFFSISIIMIVVIIIFLIYTLQHPELAFIGGNRVAYPFYVVYLLITIAMFVLSRKNRG